MSFVAVPAADGQSATHSEVCDVVDWLIAMQGSAGGYKGMALVVVRQWVRAAGPETERRLLDALTSEERVVYASLVATAWVPVEFATSFYVAAAPLLYPTIPRPLLQIGRDLARENLRGVFRFVIKIMSQQALMARAAALWRSFHDRGTASVVREGPFKLRFEVVGYPGLPERMRETISGWFVQALELTGAENARVVKSDDDAERWAWTATWR